MSTLSSQLRSTPPHPHPVRARDHALAPISLMRLVRVEFQKMFDTRSGFWLLASIGILSALATGAVIAFAGDAEITFNTFSAAVGVPLAILLPVLAILSVTSEWSQRTGLTSFTLVPHRAQVIGAKLIVSLAVGVLAMLTALSVGALGNLLGAAIHGIDPVWGVSLQALGLVVLANILGMSMGFMFGTVLRNSPIAIVAYFVYSLVLPNLFGALAVYQDWFHELWPWVDFFYSTTRLYELIPTPESWAQLGVSGLIWLVIPLALGLRSLLRTEVK